MLSAARGSGAIRRPPRRRAGRHFTARRHGVAQSVTHGLGSGHGQQDGGQEPVDRQGPQLPRCAASEDRQQASPNNSTSSDGLAVQDVLSKTELDLMELLDVVPEALDRAIGDVSRSVCPPCRTVLDLMNSQAAREQAAPLKSSLEELDLALGGGIPLGAVTELVGPAGVGKTQFCLMLAIFATLPKALGGLSGSVFYIDTEKKFSSQRLVEIAQTRFPGHFKDSQSIKHLTMQVLVISPDSAMELVSRLKGLEEAIIEYRVRLLILDGIASLMHSHSGKDQINQRQELLGQQAALLKFLAEQFRIPVVVTNQVVAQMRSSSRDPNFSFEKESNQDQPAPGGQELLTAALGTKWAHCVNVRLVLERVGGGRLLKVAKSPMAALMGFPYLITSAGIRLTDERLTLSSVGGLTSIRNEGDDIT
eukprot:SM000258S09113  [mRNA]  locus=s258:147916:150966:- [translate_table: standard]